jgi:hypothetical protein
VRRAAPRLPLATKPPPEAGQRETAGGAAASTDLLAARQLIVSTDPAYPPQSELVANV